jgi:hypothetical protein
VVTLFSQAHLAAPERLIRSLTGEYMVLVHQNDKPTPVILLTVSEPDAAFAGMLAWEKTIATDLSPFFTLGSLTLSSTPPVFTDTSFNNIDTRALYDGDGMLILMYTLLERNVIAITNSTATMQEVAQRLHTQRLKK